MIKLSNEDVSITISDYSTSISRLINGANYLKNNGFISLSSDISLNTILYGPESIMRDLRKDKSKVKFKNYINIIFNNFEKLFKQKIKKAQTDYFISFYNQTISLLGSNYSVNIDNIYFENIHNKIHEINRLENINSNSIKLFNLFKDLIRLSIPIFDLAYVNIKKIEFSPLSNYLNVFSSNKIKKEDISQEFIKFSSEILNSLNNITILVNLFESINKYIANENISLYERQISNKENKQRYKETFNTEISKKENSNNSDGIKILQLHSNDLIRNGNHLKFNLNRTSDEDVSFSISIENANNNEDPINLLSKLIDLNFIQFKNIGNIIDQLKNPIDSYPNIDLKNSKLIIKFKKDFIKSIEDDADIILVKTNDDIKTIKANNKNLFTKKSDYAFNVKDLIFKSSNIFEVDRTNIIKKIKNE